MDIRDYLNRNFDYAGFRKRIKCVVRGHQWKRAVRFLGNTGTQTCRRCATKRNVELRPRRQPIARTGADVAKG